MSIERRELSHVFLYCGVEAVVELEKRRTRYYIVMSEIEISR